jgi:cobalt-precorrin 5A hydrolase
MIAIGIGATRRVSELDIAAAVAELVTSAGLCADTLATFVGAPFSETVSGVARGAGFAFVALPLTGLQARNAECQTQSKRSTAAHGVASIAEAAALVAAGAGSRLVAARRVVGNVTVAAAQSAEHREAMA